LKYCIHGSAPSLKSGLLKVALASAPDEELELDDELELDEELELLDDELALLDEASAPPDELELPVCPPPHAARPNTTKITKSRVCISQSFDY
jgi:hypothetical protein